MVCGKRLDKPVLQAQSQIREMQWLLNRAHGKI